jgi:hypothetical protein
MTGLPPCPPSITTLVQTTHYKIDMNLDKPILNYSIEIGQLTNYGQKSYFWTFLDFSHGGMMRRTIETSAFRLSQRVAECLKIENFI